jgi:hypothetical protein
MSFAIPPGRGRWRLTLHRRQFTDATLQSTLIAELPAARSRRLEQTLNGSATLTFTLDGRSAEAALIAELATDVVAWRWDEIGGHDKPYFRGIVAQSQDTLSEQSHVVTFTCHDYLAMLARRYVTGTLAYTNTDQDTIARGLVAVAVTARSTPSPGYPTGVPLSPGSYLPLHSLLTDPNNQPRSISGQARDRTYEGSTEILTAFDQLAHVIGGFDYDVVPPGRFNATDTPYDTLRIFYPSQGVARAEPVLEYGGRIASLTRSTNSANFANFERVLGNNGDTTPGAPQLYSEQWNPADLDVTEPGAVGLWMDAQNGADVSIQSTLDDQAHGALDLMGVLEPSYSLALTPDTYTDRAFNMGDTVPVVVQSGRLDVTTTQRIVGMSFEMTDDGAENVGLTVGRSLTSLADLLTETARDVNALARR